MGYYHRVESKGRRENNELKVRRASRLGQVDAGGRERQVGGIGISALPPIVTKERVRQATGVSSRNETTPCPPTTLPPPPAGCQTTPAYRSLCPRLCSPSFHFPTVNALTRTSWRFTPTPTNLPRSWGVVGPSARHEQARPTHGPGQLFPVRGSYHDILPGRDEEGGALDVLRASDRGHRLEIAPRPLLNAVSEHSERSVDEKSGHVHLGRWANWGWGVGVGWEVASRSDFTIGKHNAKMIAS